MERIEAQQEQLRVAAFKADKEGSHIDGKWLAMKQGMIHRMRQELEARLTELDNLELQLDAKLVPRILVRIV